MEQQLLEMVRTASEFGFSVAIDVSRMDKEWQTKIGELFLSNRIDHLNCVERRLFVGTSVTDDISPYQLKPSQIFNPHLGNFHNKLVYGHHTVPVVLQSRTSKLSFMAEIGIDLIPTDDDGYDLLVSRYRNGRPGVSVDVVIQDFREYLFRPLTEDESVVGRAEARHKFLSDAVIQGD